MNKTERYSKEYQKEKYQEHPDNTIVEMPAGATREPNLNEQIRQQVAQALRAYDNGEISGIAQDEDDFEADDEDEQFMSGYEINEVEETNFLSDDPNPEPIKEPEPKPAPEPEPEPQPENTG